MKKKLVLPIKKQWFDMILSGEKTEEYRDFTVYWARRLGQYYSPFDSEPAPPTHIEFRNGYGRSVPSVTFEVVSIKTGIGKPEWGAPQDEQVFIITLKKPQP